MGLDIKRCSHEDCNLNIYGDSTECILHCEKSSKYQHSDWGLYEAFREALIVEIAEQLESSSDNDISIVDKKSAIQILDGELIENLFPEPAIRDMVENAFLNIVVLDYIVFPPRKSQDNFDYQSVLEKLNAIHFNFCEFNTMYLKLDTIKCFFQDCHFHTSWILPNCNILENADNVIYQTCIFYENTSSYFSDEKVVLYEKSQFDYTCRFEKELRFDNAKLKNPLFYSAQNNFLQEKNFIKTLTFNNCIFEQPFRLNNYQIDYFICNDSIFKNKSKFEFKKNKVEQFVVSNSNFKSLVDCYRTEFKHFLVEKSIFEKFTGFEQCQFGNKTKKDNIAHFQYATFLDFVNFREAKFYNGLDLQNANLKEYPNFLGIEVEPTNTNRETFRIIKHAFDKVGNTLEANKFFAYEMDKERQKSENEFDKKVILNLNYWISNFGQSWLRPLVLIVVLAILQTLLYKAIDSGYFNIIDSSHIAYSTLKHIVDFSDELAKNIIPISKSLTKGKEFLSLVFLIIYSTLVYNFVVAVKRVAKR